MAAAQLSPLTRHVRRCCVQHACACVGVRACVFFYVCVCACLHGYESKYSELKIGPATGGRFR